MNPLNSSVIFCNFPNFPKFLENSGKEFVRIRPQKKSYCGTQGILFFGFRPNSSAFVRFWKIWENDFSNFFFLSHFPEVQ